MSDTGWFDKFSNQEISRTVDSNGFVSYKTTKTQGKPLIWYDDNGKEQELYSTSTELLELPKLYFDTLRHSKKTLTPELKQVIDDLVPDNLNLVWGITEYSQKTPLGHAIDDINVETVEYLISQGADVTISGPNQKHILQELLASNATEKRIQILELVLKRLPSGVVKLIKGFDDKFYSIKYLIPLINSNQLTDDDLELLYNESKNKQKNELLNNCERMTLIAFEKGDYSSIPQELRDLFLF